jgi:hypothetical protein
LQYNFFANEAISVIDFLHSVALLAATLDCSMALVDPCLHTSITSFNCPTSEYKSVINEVDGSVPGAFNLDGRPAPYNSRNFGTVS